MIAGISIRNFKSIRLLGAKQPLSLGRFHVLVGPNASGKSTFLETVEFVQDCLLYGPQASVEYRVPQFSDLTFMRRGGPIEIDCWLDIGYALESQTNNLLRYQLVISEDSPHGIHVQEESLKAYSKSWRQPGRGLRFSDKVKPRRLLGKTSKGTDFYQRESGKYQDSFVFGRDKLTLSHTPPDEERYPTANAVRRFLMQGVRYVQLNSRKMRDPCPATQPTEIELDGTNLPRVVGRLQGGNTTRSRKKEPFRGSEAISRWTEHLRYALKDLEEIGWARREPDNAEYITLRYANGLECPSWLLSDGTLRLMALTLLAFLPPTPGIYMVEEPENGVHPEALEIILRSLSTIPRAQVFIATHSPLVVQSVGTEPLLCFSKDQEGARILHGADHPVIKAWEGTPDLATVFASGILG